MALSSIQNKIFFLTLLFLPTQLGRHFWPDFSVVSGIRVDYLSPTIYLTDVLILILFILWLAKGKFSIFNFQFLMKSKFKNFNIKNSFQISSRQRRDKFQISLFVVFLIVGILMSKSPVLGFYGFLKLIEFGFFGFYTANYLRGASFYFAIGIIFESLLGIAHYLNQGSIGGILYFFGEREFNQSTPGIANASINGELILRPYGTFPHPNVLAGYLVIAMAIVISRINPSTKLRTGDQRSKIKRTIFVVAIVTGTITLFLTMSRVAIFIWIIFLIVFFLKKTTLKFKFLIGAIIILFLLNLISFNLFPQRFTNITLADESVQMRRELIESSFVVIKNNPIFGVGLNNFMINTAFYLQPVHNIYLLIASETGLAGFFFFVWFIAKTFRRIKNQESRIKNDKPIIHNSRFIILTMVLIFGLFDHYFLTLQQGQLLFSFILGLCWRGKQHI